MTSDIKLPAFLIIVILILCIVAGLIYYFGWGMPSALAPEGEKYQQEQDAQDIVPPSATEDIDIDSVASALLKETEAENALVAGEELEVSWLEIDTQAIGDFGQSYDTNEF